MRQTIEHLVLKEENIETISERSGVSVEVLRQQMKDDARNNMIRVYTYVSTYRVKKGHW